jgi:hypothetical protein
MREHFLRVVLVLCCSSAVAASLNAATVTNGDVERFAQALEWRDKWQRVIARQAESYVDKHIRVKLSQLPKDKQRKIAETLESELRQHFSWEQTGRRFSREIVSECGTHLLEKFLRLSAGDRYPADERREITNSYKNCAKGSIDTVLGKISDRFTAGNRKIPDNKYNKAIANELLIRKKARKSFTEKYLDASGHKAFAQSDSGNWNWRSNRTSEDHAINNALASCRTRNREFENVQPCKIVNLNGTWVERYRISVNTGRKDKSVLMSKKALNSYREKVLTERKNKAFAQSDTGSWSWRSSAKSEADAKQKALSSCRKNNKKHEAFYPCRIVNTNNNWQGE